MSSTRQTHTSPRAPFQETWLLEALQTDVVINLEVFCNASKPRLLGPICATVRSLEPPARPFLSRSRFWRSRVAFSSKRRRSRSSSTSCCDHVVGKAAPGTRLLVVALAACAAASWMTASECNRTRSSTGVDSAAAFNWTIVEARFMQGHAWHTDRSSCAHKCGTIDKAFL